MTVPQFKRDGSLYPIFLSETDSLLMYHLSAGNHLGQENHVYTKLCKCDKKSKIKDFNSPMNKPLIVLYYWSKKIEEDFHLHKPDKINLSDKYTTHDVTNVMISMVNHVNYMEQGMIGIQEKSIALENERLKKSICIDQLIRENISTKKPLHQLLYILNYVHTRVKK